MLCFALFTVFEMEDLAKFSSPQDISFKLNNVNVFSNAQLDACKISLGEDRLNTTQDEAKRLISYTLTSPNSSSVKFTYTYLIRKITLLDIDPLAYSLCKFF